MSLVELLFYLFGALAVAGAVGVVSLKNPVHAALSLLVSFLSVAVLFFLRFAEFLGVVQILVYAGGILVLFLFVIMMVNIRKLTPGDVFLSPMVPVAVVAAVGLAFLLWVSILAGSFSVGQLASAATENNTKALAKLLYTNYLIPFEVASVILLVAMVGAIVFGGRRRSSGGEG